MLTLDLRKRFGVLSLYLKERKLQVKKIKWDEKKLENWPMRRKTGGENQRRVPALRNPVRRGLVARPEDWKWSSVLHYSTGKNCAVEIESHWTVRRREQLRVYPVVRRRDAS
jgi:hypothetical protein